MKVPSVFRSNSACSTFVQAIFQDFCISPGGSRHQRRHRAQKGHGAIKLVIGIPLLAFTLGAAAVCPPPVHENCQMPPFNPQPYDPNRPYKAPDMREYNRCMADNRREDARYQQCVEQEQRERQRERQEQQRQRYCPQNPNASGCN